MLSKTNILSALAENKSRLSKFGVTKIGLFGSYSRNEQNVNSDIDILIDFSPANETFDNLISSAELIEKLFDNNKVEIVTRNGLSKYISPYILNEVIYV